MQKIQTNIKIVYTGEKNLHIFKIFKSFTHSLESTVFEKPQGSVCVWGGDQIDPTHRPTRLRLLRAKTYFINGDILFMIYIHVSRLVNLG